MRKGALAVALGALIVFLAAPAFAALGLVETSTKTIGFTTITWDSSWADFDYPVGTPITMTVTWTVDAGAAEYLDTTMPTNGFALKRFTPRSKKDPAEGELSAVGPVDDSATDRVGSVEVEFKFTGLHFDKTRKVDIGNAHFKLLLKIDKDGDGYVDTVAGYGVNVHVEDPYPW